MYKKIERKGQKSQKLSIIKTDKNDPADFFKEQIKHLEIKIKLLGKTLQIIKWLNMQQSQ